MNSKFQQPIGVIDVITLTPDHSGSVQKGAINPSARDHVQSIVKGIIEGETRVIVSSMTMEEIFKERQIFKQKVIEQVQHELNQFGLCIYNANVKELQDTPGSEYFAFLSRKAHEGASNQARVDVATAQARGSIGESAQQAHARQEIAKIEAETAVLETKRKGDRSEADAALTNRKTELDMGVQLSQIKAKRVAEARDAELQKDVELKKAETELERLRAKDVVKSKIHRETVQQEAEGNLFREMKAADARLYQQSKEAEGHYLRQIKEADAAFYAKRKEAEGKGDNKPAFRVTTDKVYSRYRRDSQSIR